MQQERDKLKSSSHSDKIDFKSIKEATISKLPWNTQKYSEPKGPRLISEGRFTMTKNQQNLPFSVLWPKKSQKNAKQWKVCKQTQFWGNMINIGPLGVAKDWGNSR